MTTCLCILTIWHTRLYIGHLLYSGTCTHYRTVEYLLPCGGSFAALGQACNYAHVVSAYIVFSQSYAHIVSAYVVFSQS